MKVLQILPELNSGGVERGTLEVARALTRAGHEALVVSQGGRLVGALEAGGARHIALPVHRKSLLTLLQVAPLRRLLERERPEVLHIRSRVPGWVAWLAWRKLPAATRPRLVSTVHGFYSVNAYSAIMTRGERVIAVSESVRDQVLRDYPQLCADRIKVIHRGVSAEEFPRGYRPPEEWLAKWSRENPALAGKKVLALPGRITRWKGQRDFIELIGALKARGMRVHGLIVGETHPKKRAYLDELAKEVADRGLAGEVSFLGHRPDVREVMAASDIVYSLSQEPEAFGRVTLEAASLGRPVIGYDHGGVSEQLGVFMPEGRVKVGDGAALLAATERFLADAPAPRPVQAPFTLEAMTGATLGVYAELAKGAAY